MFTWKFMRAALAAGVSLAAACYGQSGNIAGTVYGGSGIVLPNPVVTIRSESTGQRTSVTANYSGKYEVRDLQPGAYTITVSSMDGFPEARRMLRAGEKLTVDLRIRPLTISPESAKPPALTMAQLRQQRNSGVAVAEVSDYVYGDYKGEFASASHADGNPRRAVIVSWKDFPYRMVFSHEASYCPWMELADGSGAAFQFLEGNDGWAELFNDFGRKQRNSFVDILESGPTRVWVRWSYLGVNMRSGEAAYRASEDFWAYPNGLVVRRQSYETLRAGDPHGYTREPVELMAMCPVGKLWYDVLQRDDGESHALAVLDAFSPKRYDVFWKRKPGGLWEGTARRAGSTWKELDDAAGVALVLPMKDGSPFTVFGDASGYRHDFTRIKEHSHTDTGGVGWVSQSWDHWPIGWTNSQGHVVDRESLQKYPNSFSPAGMDFFALPNEESERGIYFSLIGVGGHDLEQVRALARRWLELGARGLSNPDGARGLPAIHSRRQE